MDNRIIVVLLSLLLLDGCVERKGNDTNTIVVDANVNNRLEVFHSSFFVDSVQYIPILNNEDFIPENNIRYCSGSYFIVDRKTQQIYRISEDGEVIARIGHQGRSDKEYIGITLFDVNPETSEVFVYECHKNRLIIYSGTGEYVRGIDLYDSNSLFRDMVVFPNGNILGCAFDYNGPELHRGVWMIDSEGRFIKEVIQVKKGIKYDIMIGLPLFSRIDDNHIAIMGSVGDDNVYFVDSEGNIYRKYIFSFGAPISKRMLHQEADVSTLHSFFLKTSFCAFSNWIKILGSYNDRIYAFSYNYNVPQISDRELSQKKTITLHRNGKDNTKKVHPGVQGQGCLGGSERIVNQG